MACKPNEIAILKGQCVKLDDEHVMMLNLMFHTASKENKKAGEKSFYRYEGIVLKIADFKQLLIEDLKKDENAMGTWVWPTKNDWWKPEYFIAYYGDKTNKMASKWYKNRLAKMISWDNFIKLATEGIKMTAKGPKKYDNARYDLQDYVTEAGESFNIDSPETMIKLVGQIFTHPIQLKRDL